jgi:hypothetical protein
VGRPALKREVVACIIDHYGLALARACKLIRQVRSTQYVRSRKDPKLSLRGAWTTMRIALTHLLRWQDRAKFILFGQYISGPFVDHADGTGDRGSIGDSPAGCVFRV